MTDRHTADKHLERMGYQHPETSNQNRDPYKKYTGNGEKVYTSSSGSSIYSTEKTAYNEDPNQKIETCRKSEEICPTCKKPAMYKCSCTEFGDMMCADGHYWYIVDGNVRVGDPH